VLTKIAQIQGDAGDPAGALDSYRQCERAGQDWLARNPDNPAARNVVAMARERVAYYAMLAGEPAGAEEAVRGAIATYEAGNPTPRLRRNVAMAYNTLAAVQGHAGDPEKALLSCRHALGLSEALQGEDPKNSQYGIDIAQEKVLLIDLLLAAGQQAEARQTTALTLAQLKAPAHDSNPSIYYLVDYLKLLLETPFIELRAGEDALALAHKAVGMTRDTETLDLLAKAYRQAGQVDEAVATEKAAIALLPPLPPGRPSPEIRVKLNATLASFAKAAEDQREGK
jgi:tetratricopeptide (TPR) repeat protein